MKKYLKEKGIKGYLKIIDSIIRFSYLMIHEMSHIFVLLVYSIPFEIKYKYFEKIDNRWIIFSVDIESIIESKIVSLIVSMYLFH